MQIDANSTFSSRFSKSSWLTAVILTLAFWLSSSLLLDLLVMPSLYMTGMMTQPGFAGAGYVLFWLFNRLELVCAAVVLTGLFVVRNTHTLFSQRGYAGVLLSALLLTIALIDTYGLTPHMSALGMQLNLFEAVEVPAAMNQLHSSYWLLEVLKLSVGGILLSLCWRDRV